MGSGGIGAHSGQVWAAVLQEGLQLNCQLLEWENYIEENICGKNWKWDWFLDRELYIFYVCCCPSFYWLSIKISHCQIHYCILEEDLSFCYWLMLRELQMKFNCWWRTVYILCILLPRLWGLSFKISYHEIHYRQPGEYLSFLYARLKNGCIILWQYLRIRQSFPDFFQHALRYEFETGSIHSVAGMTCQVWISLQLKSYCWNFGNYFCTFWSFLAFWDIS